MWKFPPPMQTDKSSIAYSTGKFPETLRHEVPSLAQGHIVNVCQWQQLGAPRKDGDGLRGYYGNLSKPASHRTTVAIYGMIGLDVTEVPSSSVSPSTPMLPRDSFVSPWDGLGTS